MPCTRWRISDLTCTTSLSPRIEITWSWSASRRPGACIKPVSAAVTLP